MTAPVDDAPVDDAPDLCAQCGLPNPPRARYEWNQLGFCCQGCRAAYRILKASGLEEALAVGDLPLDGRERANPTGNRYHEYDDQDFQNDSCTTFPDGTRSIEFLLEGVHCASCVRLLESLPRWVKGLLETRLNLRGSTIRLRWNPEIVSLSHLGSILDSMGYPTHPLRARTQQAHERILERRQLLQLAFAGALAGNTMLVAIALYAGTFEGMAVAHEQLFRWISLGLGMLSLLGPGRTFFRGAWTAIRARSSHMDLPIALGLGAGGVAGVINTIRGTGEIYFDSLTVLVFLLLVGRWLQSRQQRRAADSIELLFSLTPRRARRLRDSKVEVIPIDAIQIGDEVEVLAGDLVPVDGSVVSGSSTVDASLLTGESIPIEIGQGDALAAGVTNQTARVVMKVEATGSETRIGRLMSLVESATADRSPVVQLADRIAGWFVLIVLGLAVATWLTWSALGDPHAIRHAIALLIVACPCALGLATPLTLAVTLGRAARQRVLIRSADVIEGLAHQGTIYLDKTGTCTQGRLQVVEWFGDQTCQKYAASLQSQSAHPIARAMSDYLAECGIESNGTVAEVEQDKRGGIRGLVSGVPISIGNTGFVTASGAELSESMLEFIDQTANQGHTPVLVAIDTQIVAAVALGDPIRSDAHESIAAMKRAGWKIGMLSGDHPLVVKHVAAQLGIESDLAKGSLAPEDKLEIVKEQQKSSPVVMVGDGVNDSASLAAATVGIAVKNGAEASLEAAPVYIAQEGLHPIVSLCQASKRALNTVRIAISLSLGYNILAVSLAALGLITPLVAAIIMPISSLTVVLVAVTAPGIRSKS